MKIEEVFNRSANNYHKARRGLIPCFDDFYNTVIDIINFNKDNNIKILDLGAGTGLLASLILEKFPKADLTLMDISEKMLNIAKERLSNRDAKYILGDYTLKLPDKGFDIVVSALSIHHLSRSEKEKLIKKIYTILNPNGVFINADQVLGQTDSIEKRYRSKWLDDVKRRGVSKKDLDAALVRMKEDNMCTLNDQLKYLKNSGFIDINCWYKYYNFVVYSGLKQSL